MEWQVQQLYTVRTAHSTHEANAEAATNRVGQQLCWLLMHTFWICGETKANGRQCWWPGASRKGQEQKAIIADGYSISESAETVRYRLTE
jgi:hypothetical protein